MSAKLPRAPITGRRVRVFLADDHDLVRAGLRGVLEASGRFKVVGEAQTGRQVLDARQLASADVLILDLSMPKVAGAEVLNRLRETHPQVGVVVLSMHPAETFERPLLAAGAVAYVAKSRPSHELLDLLTRLARGQTAEPTAPEVAGGLEALSPREHQILARYVGGTSVTALAAELDVNACTVSNHLARIRAKLGARNNVDLVHLAHRLGLVEPLPGEP